MGRPTRYPILLGMLALALFFRGERVFAQRPAAGAQAASKGAPAGNPGSDAGAAALETIWGQPMRNVMDGNEFLNQPVSPEEAEELEARKAAEAQKAKEQKEDILSQGGMGEFMKIIHGVDDSDPNAPISGEGVNKAEPAPAPAPPPAKSAGMTPEEIQKKNRDDVDAYSVVNQLIPMGPQLPLLPNAEGTPSPSEPAPESPPPVASPAAPTPHVPPPVTYSPAPPPAPVVFGGGGGPPIEVYNAGGYAEGPDGSVHVIMPGGGIKTFAPGTRVKINWGPGSMWGPETVGSKRGGGPEDHPHGPDGTDLRSGTGGG